MEITEGFVKKGFSVKDLNKKFLQAEDHLTLRKWRQEKKGVFGLKIPKTPAEQASRANSQ